eukprot:CAMPEP_0113302380 /NCGR_PEP_ID=MMETSP0010_2-20120614/3217_1 /TAXON_ID=216773 ORGANISM="Corethron hystrix, Strain 308" /NCGR_SAMPLE_ID=MMETSP0010_2 /ASSEMBLY_ACC=CAM_ASM_000155 /LENGTH=793 /DNA_ID=CAMNT_0000156161 /DNA_START=305 /DNA_END=2686 /DNA_ORIENTATION=+ /assembly_acc=CAM_ASM_000155
MAPVAAFVVRWNRGAPKSVFGITFPSSSRGVPVVHNELFSKRSNAILRTAASCSRKSLRFSPSSCKDGHRCRNFRYGRWDGTSTGNAAAEIYGRKGVIRFSTSTEDENKESDLFVKADDDDAFEDDDELFPEFWDEDVDAVSDNGAFSGEAGERMRRKLEAMARHDFGEVSDAARAEADDIMASARARRSFSTHSSAIDDADGGDEIKFETDDMDSRIAAAKSSDSIMGFESSDDGNDEEDGGMLPMPKSEEGYLGYQHPEEEIETYLLNTDAMHCPACGVKFQCGEEVKPGYIPKEKYEYQVEKRKWEKILEQREARKNREWTVEDEVEWLITDNKAVDSSDASAMKEENGDEIPSEFRPDYLDENGKPPKRTICQRCHHLQNYGEVRTELRPGWTEEPLLSQEAFRELLYPIRDRDAVVVALVDLFDFGGSVLPELDAIAGEHNPVILAVNKADLLPEKMGQLRAESWVRSELDYMGVRCVGQRRGDVRLVSAQTGFGVSNLISRARKLADEIEGDIYVVGAANAGKSTLMNRLIQENAKKSLRFKKNMPKKKVEELKKKKLRKGNKPKGMITASPLPGTTLEFIKLKIGEGLSLYDTPGLLVPGTLTSKLTPAELKMVVPKKKIDAVTIRISSGSCVLVGGLARIEVVDGSKPFLFTFYVSNEIKLHPTSSDKAEEFVVKHVGGLLTPPMDAERVAELGEFESHLLDIECFGWKEAAADVAIRGLGWIAVTGAGVAKVRVSVPKGTGISVRPPLMPFDVWETTATFTGGKLKRKGGKTASGKWRKGIKRR